MLHSPFLIKKNLFETNCIFLSTTKHHNKLEGDNAFSFPHSVKVSRYRRPLAGHGGRSDNAPWPAPPPAPPPPQGPESNVESRKGESGNCYLLSCVDDFRSLSQISGKTKSLKWLFLYIVRVSLLINIILSFQIIFRCMLTCTTFRFLFLIWYHWCVIPHLATQRDII